MILLGTLGVVLVGLLLCYREVLRGIKRDDAAWEQMQARLRALNKGLPFGRPGAHFAYGTALSTSCHVAAVRIPMMNQKRAIENSLYFGSP